MSAVYYQRVSFPIRLVHLHVNIAYGYRHRAWQVFTSAAHVVRQEEVDFLAL